LQALEVRKAKVAAKRPVKAPVKKPVAKPVAKKPVAKKPVAKKPVVGSFFEINDPMLDLCRPNPLQNPWQRNLQLNPLQRSL
jgi:hypothetical protein